ncbi:MAG: hypothetical protein LAP13_08890 [Acidobacteriia bacterium]|nr:hypothetical protein [Terriglobia bacterium]
MRRAKLLRTLVLGAGLGVAWLALGCGGGGGGGNNPPPSNVSITVSPSSASMGFDATQQFTATVSGTTNTGVAWSISPSSNGGISTSGLYTAPSAQIPAPTTPQTVSVTPGPGPSPVVNFAVDTVPQSTSVTVTATSQADSTKSASATVTINPLSLVAVGTCDTSGSCSGGAVGVSAAPGGTLTLFLVGYGVGSNDTFSFSGNPGDVTISAGSAQFCMTQAQSGIPSQPCVTFDINVNASATPGQRNIMATSSGGELATFVGGLLITGP